MEKSPYQQLSRRERQIMDVVYRFGRVTVSAVKEEIPDPPSYSAVRAMLAKLENKGYLTHSQDGPRYVYQATQPRDEVREGAVARLVRTFFDGSVAKATAAMLSLESAELSDEELDELASRIEDARKGER